MARPPIGKCVHCLKDPVPRTWDHVFPESWYPETTPANTEKWKIPACLPCNAEYGKIEQDIFLAVGLCIDPNACETAGIVPKALRSLDPRHAKNPKDRRMREAKRAKLLRRVLKGTDIPESAIYPGFEKKWGRPVEERVAFPMPRVKPLFEKIVRGIFYIQDQKFIEPPFAINLYPPWDEVSSVFVPLLARFGETYAREPGIVVRRAVTKEDFMSSIFAIEIWGTFRTFAMLMDSERDAAVRAARQKIGET